MVAPVKHCEARLPSTHVRRNAPSVLSAQHWLSQGVVFKLTQHHIEWPNEEGLLTDDTHNASHHRISNSLNLKSIQQDTDILCLHVYDH